MMGAFKKPATAAILAASVLVLWGAAALAQPVADQLKAERGKALAGRWCVSCHGTATRGSDAAPTFQSIARSRSPDEIRAFLAKPHGKMPPLELSNGQIDDLATYIGTQK